MKKKRLKTAASFQLSLHHVWPIITLHYILSPAPFPKFKSFTTRALLILTIRK